MRRLTRRQAELKAFIAECLACGKEAPSLDEMRIALRLKSKSTVHHHVRELERRGHIVRHRHESHESRRRAPAISRAIVVIAEGLCPQCGHGLEERKPNSQIRGTARARAGVLDPTMHGAAPEGVSPPHTKAPCAPLTLYNGAQSASAEATFAGGAP